MRHHFTHSSPESFPLTSSSNYASYAVKRDCFLASGFLSFLVPGFSICVKCASNEAGTGYPFPTVLTLANAFIEVKGEFAGNKMVLIYCLILANAVAITAAPSAEEMAFKLGSTSFLIPLFNFEPCKKMSSLFSAYPLKIYWTALSSQSRIP